MSMAPSVEEEAVVVEKKLKKLPKEEQKKSEIDSVNALIKKFGKVIKPASDIKDEKQVIIPTTPQMDIMLSGGVPEGSFIVISGPYGLGKSAISFHIAGNAQKTPGIYGDRDVFYFDIEGRIKRKDIYMNKNIPNPDKIHIVGSSKGNIIMAEEFIEIGESLIETNPGAVFIFDSFSALCTKERKDAEIGDRFRDNTSLLLANFCKRICQLIAVNKSVVIGITHRIANQGMGPAKWVEASGQKIQYQADIKLKGTHQKAWMDGDDQIGQDVFWECEKSALGPPHKSAVCKLRYKHGFDETAELFDLCVGLSLIKKNGAWFSYIQEDGEELKFQGQNKVINYMTENADFTNMLKTKLFTEYYNFEEAYGL